MSVVSETVHTAPPNSPRVQFVNDLEALLGDTTSQKDPSDGGSDSHGQADISSGQGIASQPLITKSSFEAAGESVSTDETVGASGHPDSSNIRQDRTIQHLLEQLKAKDKLLMEMTEEHTALVKRKQDTIDWQNKTIERTRTSLNDLHTEMDTLKSTIADWNAHDKTAERANTLHTRIALERAKFDSEAKWDSPRTREDARRVRQLGSGSANGDQDGSLDLTAQLFSAILGGTGPRHCERGATACFCGLRS